MKILKISQIPNFPEQKTEQIAVQYMSGGPPDISEISSEFGQANEAVRLVDNYLPGILRDVAYIAKDHGSGRYGAYATALTRAIKASAVKKILQNQGYEVGISDNGEVTAIDRSGKKTPEDIQQDIVNAKNNLSGKRGAVLLINTDSIMNTVREHYERIKSQYEVKGVENINSSPYELWLKIYHLGLTIAHEAGHAEEDVQRTVSVGGQENQAQLSGEGHAESREREFDQGALPYINQNLKSALSLENEEDFVPIESWFEITASYNGMVKIAQYENPKPSFLFEPNGSDLSGRFPSYLNNNEAWGLINQQDQSVPLERRLNRNFMAPLPPDLIQEKEILELQLRKYTREDFNPDSSLLIEELLSSDHDETIAYMTLEELLEENRPKPLMVPIGKNKDTGISWIQKSNSHEKITKTSMNKVAYSFFGTLDTGAPWGPYQNLDIKLEDRIYSADDEEPHLADKEMEIRKQFRYNPTYTRGIYYTVDNIRGFPYLADNPNNENMHLHPLERMASGKIDKDYCIMDSKLLKVFSFISKENKKILNGDSLCSRFVLTKDFFPILGDIFDSKYVRIDIFETENCIGEDPIYNAWVYSSKIPPENIEKMEMFLSYGEKDKDADVLVEKLLGSKSIKTKREKTIKKVINSVKKICERYDVNKMYLSGGCVRDIEMGNSLSEICNLDFVCNFSDVCVKIGYLLADELGVPSDRVTHNEKSICFEFDGITVNFIVKYCPERIKEKLVSIGEDITPINIDVYNRDFTVNMLIYDVLKEKVLDITGRSKKDISNKVIKTFFDPCFVCCENPLVMLRALKWKLKYDFDIDLELVESIKKNSHMLFDGRYSDDILVYERNKVEIEGKEEADNLFYALGLEKILDY